MSKRVVLQVPMEATLRARAEAVAAEEGLTSLQDVIRMFLTKFAARELTLRFEEPPVQLSKKAIKRYEKIHEEIVSGKVKTVSFDRTDDLIRYLNA